MRRPPGALTIASGIWPAGVIAPAGSSGGPVGRRWVSPVLSSVCAEGWQAASRVAATTTAMMRIRDRLGWWARVIYMNTWRSHDAEVADRAAGRGRARAVLRQLRRGGAERGPAHGARVPARRRAEDAQGRAGIEGRPSLRRRKVEHPRGHRAPER